MKLYTILVFFIFFNTFSVIAKESKIDNIVAIVNNQIILESDVNQVLFLLKKEGQDTKAPLRSDFLKDKVIEELITDNLILEEANKINLIPTEEQVNNVFKSIALKKNITVNQLKRNILLDGVYEYNNYINNIKKFLQIQMIQNYKLYKRIHISKDEVNRVFKKLIKDDNQLKKINISRILLPLSNNTKNKIRDTRLLAKKIVDQLRKGYSFKLLYKEFKEKNNVFLVKKTSWISLSNIQRIFLKNFKITKKNQILGPFLKDSGFYILKINNVKNNQEDIKTEFHIQHCLIKPSIILSDEKAKKMIFKIYENIKKRVYSFDYAVKNLSDDIYSLHKKGDLGWISNKFFDHEFYSELNNLNKNQINSPMRSHIGWHIIKLLEKHQIDKYYRKKKNQAYHILWNQKMMLVKNQWLKSLKRIAYIKIIKE